MSELEELKGLLNQEKSHAVIFARLRHCRQWIFSTTYAQGSSWNDTFWKHDRFNTLLKEVRAELDEAKRNGMYVEMQQIVRDEADVVIQLFGNWIEAANPKVKVENPAGNWKMDGQKCAER